MPMMGFLLGVRLDDHSFLFEYICDFFHLCIFRGRKLLFRAQDMWSTMNS